MSCGFVGVAWGAGLLGRFAEPLAAERAYALVMVGVAIWGILEFLTGQYLFTAWFPDSSTMATIQTRGDLLRSEAAMGHSIAYGASLVMAVPMAQGFRRFGVLAQVILAVGTIVSFARGPMLALVLTIALSLLLLARRQMRRSLSIALIFISAMVGVVVNSLYANSSDVLTSSSDVRENQWSQLLGELRLFGSAGRFSIVDGGFLQVGSVPVIDSTPLRLAANYGIVISFLLIAPIVVAVIASFRQRFTVAVALAGQVPVLLVTSLITQWEAFVFFATGIVVAQIVERRRDHEPAGIRNRRTVE